MAAALPRGHRRIRGVARLAGACVLGAGLVLVLAGCSERGAASGPVTVVFKHAKLLGPVDPMPQLLAEFQSAHPGIRVKAEALPWSSDEQRQFLVINLEGG